ncbi:MAG: hypothetical protein L0G70_00875 [Rubrobacter sp.]|nr:hypothetical protein [Rubrobacter sp.]
MARAVADTALSTEGVHSLGTGAFAEVATYEGADKVLGVVVTEEEVEVHIVALYPLQVSIPELAERVRQQLFPKVESRRVDIVVEDLEVPEDARL